EVGLVRVELCERGARRNVALADRMQVVRKRSPHGLTNDREEARVGIVSSNPRGRLRVTEVGHAELAAQQAVGAIAELVFVPREGMLVVEVAEIVQLLEVAIADPWMFDEVLAQPRRAAFARTDADELHAFRANAARRGCTR